MEDEKWVNVREGIMRKPLAENRKWGLQADIMRIKPNFKDKAHRHDDYEWVYILEGSFTDAKGKHSKGEFLENNTEDIHQVTTGAEGCTLLIVWCGSVKPTAD